MDKTSLFCPLNLTGLIAQPGWTNAGLAGGDRQIPAAQITV